MCLPRSIDADSSGLTGGIWFAVQTPQTVFSVIELLGQHIVPPSETLILEIEKLGRYLGEELSKEK